MDALVVAVGLAATVFLWPCIGTWASFIPFLLGHFFLFCNTFRLGGERSLIWAATFLINVGIWPFSQNITIHVAIQLLITAALIVQCVLSKNYHGVACVQINPRGFRAGAMTEGAFTRRVLRACRIPKPIIETLTGRRMDEFDD